MGHRVWFAIVDGGRARFLEKRSDPDGYDCRREMVSADLHHRSRELGTDRPGRTQESALPTRHGVEPRSDPHQAAKVAFVDMVAAALNEAADAAEFDRLVLVAPPKMLGALRQALGEPARAKVVADLAKDLTKVATAELGPHFADLKFG